MMLYQLGVLSIRVAPFNVDSVSEDHSADFVSKPVMGIEPPLEYVGPGAMTMKMSGTLFPQEIGGMTELFLLQAMRASGAPQFLLRGDGVPMGWMAIEKVGTQSDHIGASGVGRRVKVSINLRRSPSPGFRDLSEIVAGFLE